MPLPHNRHSTYADYRTWDSDSKYDLFDGTPVMQARPSILHQNVEMQIARQLANFLDGKPCNVFTEIEVLFPDHAHQSADDVQNVYVPDIAVICEPEKLTEQYCYGAPTLIIEILSPSTAKADRVLKLNRYQSAGVQEYWIISPQERTVNAFTLQNQFYRLSGAYSESDIAPVTSLPGCSIDLRTVFDVK